MLCALYVIFDIIHTRTVEDAVERFCFDTFQLYGTVGERFGAIGLKGGVSVAAGIEKQSGILRPCAGIDGNHACARFFCGISLQLSEIPRIGLHGIDRLKLAVCGGKQGKNRSTCTPCGVCRQVMSEFCSKDFPILLEGENSDIIEITLGELLPFAFDM